MNSRTIGLGLILAGVSALAGLRALNDRDDWILLRLDLPLARGEAATRKFTSPFEGHVEIQIETGESIADGLRDRYILPTGEPSALEIGWEITSGGGATASGDARDYLYVQGMPSLLGRLRRIVMQVPFERSELHWTSLGLAGSRTIARGIGRFPVQTDAAYTVIASSQGDNRALAASSPQMVLRVDRRRWQHHYERVRILGYGGLTLIAAGLVALVGSRLRRSNVPPGT